MIFFLFQVVLQKLESNVLTCYATTNHSSFTSFIKFANLMRGLFCNAGCSDLYYILICLLSAGSCLVSSHMGSSRVV